MSSQDKVDANLEAKLNSAVAKIEELKSFVEENTTVSAWTATGGDGGKGRISINVVWPFYTEDGFDTETGLTSLEEYLYNEVQNEIVRNEANLDNMSPDKTKIWPTRITGSFDLGVARESNSWNTGEYNLIGDEVTQADLPDKVVVEFTYKGVLFVIEEEVEFTPDMFIVEPPTGFVVDETNLQASIYDLDGLLEFSAAVNEGNSFSGYTINLMDDIDLGGEEWIPIGTGDDDLNPEHPFSGMFDGKGYTISNYKVTTGYIRDTDVTLLGFFGYIFADNGNIVGVKNLTLKNGYYGDEDKWNTTVGIISPIINSDVDSEILISGINIVNGYINSFGYYGQAGIAALLFADETTVENCDLDIEFKMPLFVKGWKFWSPGFGQIQMSGDTNSLTFTEFNADDCTYLYPSVYTLEGNAAGNNQTIWIHGDLNGSDTITVFAQGIYMGQIYDTGYTVTIDGTQYKHDNPNFTFVTTSPSQVRIGNITHEDFQSYNEVK